MQLMNACAFSYRLTCSSVKHLASFVYPKWELISLSALLMFINAENKFLLRPWFKTIAWYWPLVGIHSFFFFQSSVSTSFSTQRGNENNLSDFHIAGENYRGVNVLVRVQDIVSQLIPAHH